MSAQLLTAPSVEVIRDAGDRKDDRVRLAAREGFFPHRGLEVKIDNHCLSTDTELELLLDDTVIVQHIITAAELHSPLTIHVGPENLTKNLHELNYRVKRNNEDFQTCDQPVTVHIVIKSMDELGPDDGTTPYLGSFAQISISYPQDKKNACSLTEPTSEKVKYVSGRSRPILTVDYLTVDNPNGDVNIYYANSLVLHSVQSTPYDTSKLGGVSYGLLDTYVYDGYRAEVLRIDNLSQHHYIYFDDRVTGVLLHKAAGRLYVFAGPFLEVRAAPSGAGLNLKKELLYKADMALHPNGRHLYVSAYSKEVAHLYVLDAQDLSTVSLNVLTGADQLVISPDGSRLYATNEFDGEISLIDTATNTTIKVSKSVRHPFSIGVSADGKHVYVSQMGQSSIWVLDSESLDIVRIIESGIIRIRGLLGAPDNTLFAAHF